MFTIDFRPAMRDIDRAFRVLEALEAAAAAGDWVAVRARGRELVAIEGFTAGFIGGALDADKRTEALWRARLSTELTCLLRPDTALDIELTRSLLKLANGMQALLVEFESELDHLPAPERV